MSQIYSILIVLIFLFSDTPDSTLRAPSDFADSELGSGAFTAGSPRKSSTKSTRSGAALSLASSSSVSRGMADKDGGSETLVGLRKIDNDSQAVLYKPMEGREMRSVSNRDSMASSYRGVYL